MLIFKNCLGRFWNFFSFMFMFKVSILRNAAIQNRYYSKTLHFPGFRSAGTHVNIVTFHGRKIDISPFGILTLCFCFDKVYCLFSGDSGKARQSREEIIRCWGKDGHIHASHTKMIAVIVQIRFCRG